MNVLESIKQFYKTRNASEQYCIDILSDIFEKIDSKKLLTGENHSHVSNGSILEIVLQHNSDSDRIVVFLFQDLFIEIQFNSFVRTYYFSDLINNNEIREIFIELISKILSGDFKTIEYYLKDTLTKYSYNWVNEYLPEKTHYLKAFGKIREKFTGQEEYKIVEKKAESFLIDDKQ
ncbi:hypothetical protein C8N47_1312 [Mangrovibacterium marinum]|uniref:Uncharacterized protein n=1 Tax=Mangrovibacterium marinum TaxID=1639118 RepID=A0A2T5BX56_9BACT|nr:hypothetical protein [Mangrovibacterium marinum]PTN04467.1 hypothetical protein C8N47_1312 [Mangrovibacterium marinum]